MIVMDNVLSLAVARDQQGTYAATLRGPENLWSIHGIVILGEVSGAGDRRQGIWCARGALQSARGTLRNQVETAKGLRVQAEIPRAPECSLAPRNPVEKLTNRLK
ncbi:hypothetical protein RSOLAG1IB_05663 [Rhizoctonia solani AG-1 IB]|uniref:Uncharacterized protein n=1 Tax=Thanatephorus cucumeris (strain AG1-IB / isolate 7/3/14) TaxID=1108050 RepID=A0A0B7G5X2_THACB|nr:hypothetical protein RSOLAG1IB_05663 [Rhizoctonia solani AG-1 IB]